MRAEGDFFPVGTTRQLDPERLGDHLDRLYRAAWGLCGSREDAEDLVQETYAKVLARPRLLRREDDVGYLLRALRNTFLAGRRPQSARTVTEPSAVNFMALLSRLPNTWARRVRSPRSGAPSAGKSTSST